MIQIFEDGELIEEIEVPAAPPDVRSQMDAMFGQMMAQTADIALRIEFRDGKRKLLDAWDEGDMEAVLFILTNQAVPPQFEGFKSAAIAMLQDQHDEQN